MDISLETALELDNIRSQVFAPLKTFCNQEDYQSILYRMSLADDTLWPIPILLPSHEKIEGTISLSYNNKILAEIDVIECFELEPTIEAAKIYGTKSETHPSIKKLQNRPRFALSGPLRHFSQKNPKDPIEIKKEFRNRGWKKIVGFQTRNPIHQAHEYVIKSCLETVDGLFLNPLAGPQKADDIPISVRLKTYEALIQNYFNPDSVLLSVYPAPMYYAGPREAILHALVRKNYGCTHFIVGRDHAGVGNFYGPQEAQNLTYSLEDRLGIQIVKFDTVFFDRNSNRMASSKTASRNSVPFEISGTELRTRLKNNISIPDGFSRPEILDILRDYYARNE